MKTVKQILKIGKNNPKDEQHERISNLSELDDFFTELCAGACETAKIDFNEGEYNEELDNICRQKRQAMNDDFCVFKYYKLKMSHKPEFVELANTVFAAPCTQVSVERAFSSLATLLKCNRTSMKTSTIEDILVCNQNKEIFNSINFNSLL